VALVWCLLFVLIRHGLGCRSEASHLRFCISGRLSIIMLHRFQEESGLIKDLRGTANSLSRGTDKDLILDLTGQDNIYLAAPIAALV
jgi:hypothetical protein